MNKNIDNVYTPECSDIENGRVVLAYWPYCKECKKPFWFDPEEPFAYCGCGSTEWGDPRPASYVKSPDDHD